MLESLKQRISSTWLKVLLSLIAIFGITARIIWPEIKIDATTLGLLILCLLPWFSELIESAKFPGGWEVKFRDLQKAGEKIAEQPTKPKGETERLTPPKSEEPSYLMVANIDSNLALAGLRIEIEKRLRLIGRHLQIPERVPLTQLLRELQKREVITTPTLSGLQELIHAGNNAAHGKRVEDGAADWAISYGPSVLKSLDDVLFGLPGIITP